MPARAHIARARLGLVLRRCPAILPQHMQGGSRCPGRAVEPERARWHDPVLGRWLGLTPEQPALCLRGFPGRLRVTLSRVSDPPGLGRRQGAQRAARGTIHAKNTCHILTKSVSHEHDPPRRGVHHTRVARRCMTHHTSTRPRGNPGMPTPAEKNHRSISPDRTATAPCSLFSIYLYLSIYPPCFAIVQIRRGAHGEAR